MQRNSCEVLSTIAKAADDGLVLSVLRVARQIKKARQVAGF
jgi:hypothetical protein